MVFGSGLVSHNWARGTEFQITVTTCTAGPKSGFASAQGDTHFTSPPCSGFATNADLVRNCCWGGGGVTKEVGMYMG